MKRHPTLLPTHPPAAIATDNWLDKQDILTRIHISSRTLQRWRQQKLLPYCRISGKIWYRESDLQALLQKHMVTGGE